MNALTIQPNSQLVGQLGDTGRFFIKVLNYMEREKLPVIQLSAKKGWKIFNDDKSKWSWVSSPDEIQFFIDQLVIRNFLICTKWPRRHNRAQTDESLIGYYKPNFKLALKVFKWLPRDVNTKAWTSAPLAQSKDLGAFKKEFDDFYRQHRRPAKMAPVLLEKDKVRIQAVQHYYEVTCVEILRTYRFGRSIDKLVFELHADGYSYRDIESCLKFLKNRKQIRKSLSFKQCSNLVKEILVSSGFRI